MTTAPLLSIVTVSAFDQYRLAKTFQSLSSISPSVEHTLVIPKDDLNGIDLWRTYKKSSGNFTRLVNDDGCGVYSAMNLGARASTGKYISFWNAGDMLYSKDNLQAMLKKLMQFEPNWLVHQGDFNWRSKQELSVENMEGFITNSPNAFISHQTVVVKLEKFRELGEFKLRYRVAADTEQITKLFNFCEPIFEPLTVVHVETPAFASSNHRLARLETTQIALTSLSGMRRIRAIKNIFLKELLNASKKLK